MLKALVATIAVLTAMVAGPAAPAHAESCEAHLAKHGTTKSADIAYHSIHGGESPCGYESNSRVNSESKQRYNDESSRRSRWQDKTSFDCGWSWRGGFGC